MQLIICFDFGNTRKKAAIFKQKIIIEEINIKGNEVLIIENLLLKYPNSKVILSSVINHDIEIEKILIKYSTNFIKLSHLTKIPFYPSYKKKETMGADRIALIAGTKTYPYKNHNFLVISLGTCITYNFINNNNMFLGGSISPGLQMRLKSMNDYTALLPLISPNTNYPLIGYDTNSNILSGVMIGITKEIDGVIDEYKKKYIKLICIISGGDSIYFEKQLKNKIFVDYNLLYKGLYEILQLQ